MAVQRRIVPAPAVQPSQYGLLSAAVVQDDNDAHLATGVTYESLACGTAYLTADPCWDVAGGVPVASSLTASPGLAFVTGDAFAVYAMHTCLMPGGAVQDAERIARAKLTAGESRAVEEGLALLRLLPPATAGDPYPDLTPTPGTAVALPDAIAIAEEWAAAAGGGAYSAPPTFHAARSTGAMLTNKAGVGISAENGRLQTAQGSIVSSGAGYLTASRSAIGGVTPSGTSRWLFLTGTTTVRRGPVDVAGPVRQIHGTSDEVQSVTIGGTGLTSFTLTYAGSTTGAIAATATAAQVQAALEALPSIGAGNVTVTGGAGGPYTVTFGGALADTDVTQMTSAATGGTGTVTVATVTQGGSPPYGYTNRFHMLAQRLVVVSTECFRARILVTSTATAAGL